MELTKKMLRDIIKNKAQFLTIVFIATFGVLTFSGLDSVRQGLIQSSDEYYKTVNLANMWVYTKDDPTQELNKISKMEGITEVQARLTYNATSGKNQIKLFVSDDNEISKPYIISGAKYDVNADGIWLDDEFAKENNYKVGDSVTINNKELKIKGIILSAEEIYDPPAGNAIPDYKDNGYAYMSKRTFTNTYGFYMANQVLVTYGDSVNEGEISKKIENVLGDKFVTYLMRDEQSSTNHINERIRQLTQFTYVFPALFFLLAVLTMLTTMTRLIDNQRTQIGTLMSIGYSNRRIRLHYLSYGLWMGLVGGGLGVVIGYKAIPEVLIQSFRHLAIVPYWDKPLTIGSFVSVAVMVVCCLLAVLMSCGSKLKVMPALVLRGNAQKIGKHTFMERIPFLWNRMSLNIKSTIRNISRNKVRSIMGIVGVLGSMVLILAGLGMKDSLNYTIDYTYNNLYQYNNKIEVTKSDTQVKDLKIGGTNQYIQEGTLEIRTDKEGKKYTAMFSVVDDGNFICMKESSGNEVKISEVKGLVISDKFASTLGVKEGDNVNWRFLGGKWGDVKIGKVVINSLPKVLFVSKNTWSDLNQDFQPNALFSDNNEKNLTSYFHKKDNIESKIITKESQRDSMQKVFDSTNSIIYVLLFAAILLVVVVLSSLGLLNYTEMEREYATLKVIGLYPVEIRVLAFKESLVLSFVGWVVGIPFGKIFVDVFMKILSNDTIVCLSHINFSSYILASVLVAGGALLINLLLSVKIGKINMVTSLKSNE